MRSLDPFPLFSQRIRQPADRIKKVKGAIESILSAREHYVLTTSEFDSVKAHLTKLFNER